MRAIIPAKASSERVPDKNWRPFHGDQSLVDINVEALIKAGIAAFDIHVSCEESDRLERLNRRWGVTPLIRPSCLCGNEVPLTTWIRSICEQVPGQDDLVWSQVCDPLFRQHREAIGLWGRAKQKGCDSLCVVHPFRGYILDQHLSPLGWQWGEWHTPSQQLPQFYTMPFTMSILTRLAISRTGYHVGAKPQWYVSRGGSVDIDTREDFELARHVYAEMKHA